MRAWISRAGERWTWRTYGVDDFESDQARTGAKTGDADATYVYERLIHRTSSRTPYFRRYLLIILQLVCGDTRG